MSTSIQFDIYRHEDVIGTQVKETGLYMVIFTGQSGATHYVDDVLINIAPYTLLFIGPDRQSRFSEQAAESTHVLVFSSLFYNRTAREAHSLNNNPLFQGFGEVYQLTPPGDTLTYCKTLSYLLYTCKAEVDQPLQMDLAHNIIEQILLMGMIYGEKEVSKSFKSNQDQLIVMQLKKALTEHYREHIKVKFYADLLNVAERRLTKATSTILNQTAKEVISAHVMKEAKWRLANMPDSIKAISTELGFSEEHNFSAFFKKNEKISPLQYRRKMKNASTQDEK